jgi:hypothetical protein
MTMVKNKVHLFRSEYNIEEMIDRIPAVAFSTNTDEVAEFIKSHSEKISGEDKWRGEV